MLGVGLTAALAGLVAATGACADKKSGIMLAISTDMRAPKDVNAVSISISTDGVVKHSFIGRVTPQGEVELPATLALVEPETPGATVRVRVIAFQDNKPRVLRDVRTTIASGGRVGLLRIPLNFANDGSTKSAPLADGVLPPPKTGVTTKAGPSGNALGDDFFTLFQPDCPDVQNQTWIDGECADSEVKFSSLPDYAPELIVPASAAGCFDVTRCFTGATDTGEDRLRFEPGDPGRCSLSPPTGGVGALNLALVTAATGECIRPNECYIPLDRGPTGWREDAGRVTLPKYVCKLLKESKARLFESAGGSCQPKQESATICSGGVNVPGPGGKSVRVAELADTTAVSVAGTVLYFAGGTTLGKLALAAPDAKVTSISLRGTSDGDAGAPDASPADSGAADGGAPGSPAWRVSAAGTLVALADGTAMGLLHDGTQTYPIQLVSPGSDVTQYANANAFALWAGDPPSLYATNDPMRVASPIQEIAGKVTALAARSDLLLLGGEDTVTQCQPPTQVEGAKCAATRVSGAGRFDAIVFDPGVVAPNVRAFALTASGVSSVVPKSAGGTDLALTPLARSGNASSAPLGRDGVSYARGLAANGKCVFFGSTAGVEYATTAKLTSSVLEPATDVLGVAVGPNPAGGQALYFTRFAPIASGGGVYRIALPAECVP